MPAMDRMTRPQQQLANATQPLVSVRSCHQPGIVDRRQSQASVV